jgi:hypothetical protein
VPIGSRRNDNWVDPPGGQWDDTGSFRPDDAERRTLFDGTRMAADLLGLTGRGRPRIYADLFGWDGTRIHADKT